MREYLYLLRTTADSSNNHHGSRKVLRSIYELFDWSEDLRRLDAHYTVTSSPVTIFLIDQNKARIHQRIFVYFLNSIRRPYFCSTFFFKKKAQLYPNY